MTHLDLPTAFVVFWYAFLMSLAGALVLYCPMSCVFQSLKLKDQERAHTLSITIGIIERTIYALLIYANLEVVLAGWLALKGFSNHKIEGCDVEENTKRYYAYLVGNAASLLIGILAGFILKIAYPGVSK